MVEFVIVSTLERSIKSTFIIMLVLLTRKTLNVKSVKWANFILWSILFIYLLFPFSIFIQIEELEKYVMLQYLLEPFMLISTYIKMFVQEVGYILSNLNQLMVTSILLVYTGVQVTKRNKALRNSVRIEPDSRIEELVNSFRLKRQVQIYINDEIKVPITYGVVRPKIIIQSQVLEDNNLLKYVIIHEMVHIKKFDIAFSHLKNLIMCINWYNPFILGAAKYIEDDIEILCDKLVIKRAGDTREHRKEYCMAMLKLTERNENSRFVLKLHPTKERIIVMKKWRRTVLGIVAFTVAVGASMTSFVEVRAIETNQVVANVESSYTPINEDNRVEEIIEKEYIELVENQEEIVPYIADINGKETLDGLSHKTYSFDMSSWTSANHDGFTVKLSNMSSKGNIDYEIIIKENGNLIYKNRFEKEATLKVKAQDGSSYEVIILNSSVNSLKYNIKIKSYIR